MAAIFLTDKLFALISKDVWGYPTESGEVPFIENKNNYDYANYTSEGKFKAKKNVFTPP